MEQKGNGGVPSLKGILKDLPIGRTPAAPSPRRRVNFDDAVFAHLLRERGGSPANVSAVTVGASKRSDEAAFVYTPFMPRAQQVDPAPASDWMIPSAASRDLFGDWESEPSQFATEEVKVPPRQNRQSSSSDSFAVAADNRTSSAPADDPMNGIAARRLESYDSNRMNFGLWRTSNGDAIESMLERFCYTTPDTSNTQEYALLGSIFRGHGAHDKAKARLLDYRENPRKVRNGYAPPSNVAEYSKLDDVEFLMLHDRFITNAVSRIASELYYDSQTEPHGDRDTTKHRRPSGELIPLKRLVSENTAAIVLNLRRSRHSTDEALTSAGKYAAGNYSVEHGPLPNKDPPGYLGYQNTKLLCVDKIIQSVIKHSPLDREILNDHLLAESSDIIISDNMYAISGRELSFRTKRQYSSHIQDQIFKDHIDLISEIAYRQYYQFLWPGRNSSDLEDVLTPEKREEVSSRMRVRAKGGSELSFELLKAAPDVPLKESLMRMTADKPSTVSKQNDICLTGELEPLTRVNSTARIYDDYVPVVPGMEQEEEPIKFAAPYGFAQFQEDVLYGAGAYDPHSGKLRLAEFYNQWSGTEMNAKFWKDGSASGLTAATHAVAQFLPLTSIRVMHLASVLRNRMRYNAAKDEYVCLFPHGSQATCKRSRAGATMRSLIHWLRRFSCISYLVAALKPIVQIQGLRQLRDPGLLSRLDLETQYKVNTSIQEPDYADLWLQFLFPQEMPERGAPSFPSNVPQGPIATRIESFITRRCSFNGCYRIGTLDGLRLVSGPGSSRELATIAVELAKYCSSGLTIVQRENVAIALLTGYEPAYRTLSMFTSVSKPFDDLAEQRFTDVLVTIPDETRERKDGKTCVSFALSSTNPVTGQSISWPSLVMPLPDIELNLGSSHLEDRVRTLGRRFLRVNVCGMKWLSFWLEVGARLSVGYLELYRVLFDVEPMRIPDEKIESITALAVECHIAQHIDSFIRLQAGRDNLDATGDFADVSPLNLFSDAKMHVHVTPESSSSSSSSSAVTVKIAPNSLSNHRSGTLMPAQHQAFALQRVRNQQMEETNRRVSSTRSRDSAEEQPRILPKRPSSTDPGDPKMERRPRPDSSA